MGITGWLRGHGFSSQGLFALAASLLVGCSSGSPNGTDSGEEVGSSAQALTAAQARILGFEAPTQDWHSSNGSAVTSSSSASQGSAALAVVPNGYTEVISTTMSAPGGALATATVDVRLPQALSWGEARLVMRSPSSGLSWSDLGVVSLVGRPAGSYQTLSFTVPQAVQTALNGSATDIDFRVVLNVPANSGTYLLDKLVVAADVSNPAPPPAIVNEDLSVVIPRGSNIGDVMISSSDKVTIDDRSTLAKASKLSKVANLGTNTLELGAGVKAYADVFSVGNVSFLRSGSQIAGSLTTSGTILQQNNVTISGLVKTGTSIPPNETKWSVPWPTGVTNDISRAPDAPNFDIAPGSYDSIQVYSRATITLRSGTYFINSLVLEPQAHFRVDTSSGPVLIYVRETLRLRVGLEYLKGPRGQVLFGYIGQQTALFEEALVASVVAPKSAIELRRPASGLAHEGSFFGKEVHVFSDATVLHLPLDWAFLCPQGDHDGDGVNACNETCDNDPKKTEPQFCGCGELETDSDGDGVPDCQDECDHDPINQYRGQCGCANEPDLAPAGKPCNDGIVNGNFTCNGAGTCGTPASGAPQAGCTWKTLGTHAYWFCPAATPAQAAARCNSSPGGRLVELDSYLENYFTAHFISGNALTGATDRTTEGEWTWRYTATLDAKKFWTGGASGRAYHGLFARFPGGDPRNDDALDCGLIDTKGNWSVASCTASTPYVCERPFGPSWNPGNGLHHDPQGPGTAYVDWGGHNGGGDGSLIPLGMCTTYTPGPTTIHPEYGGLPLRGDTVEVFNCDRDCPEGSSLNEAQCRALCTGAANPPPVGSTSRCSNTGNPSTQLAWLMPDTCSVANRDCSAASQTAGQTLTCGERTRCFEVRKRADNNWTAQKCADGCGPNTTCDSVKGLCVESNKFTACATRDGDACVGQCFNQIGCGVPEAISNGGYTEVDRPCEETRFCPAAGDYSGPMNGPDLSAHEPINLAQLPDQSTAAPPPYSNDFQTACGGGTCNGCAADGNPSCDRAARHPWCNMDAALPPTSTGDSAVRDTRKGGRGSDSSLIKFDVDPGADLDFNVEPLPFGLARFDLKAAAAIRATAKFSFVGISGDVEIVDLRGQLIASMCRVSTAESKMEILGADFLPSLASDLLFDTAVDQPSLTKSCEDAVNTYVDVVDRAKKAMRDAQELIKQYEDLKKTGHTFGTAFCKAVADAGVRPKGMPGADLADPCANESPRDTVNAFISYYKSQVGLIDGARQALADAVLDSHKLADAVGLGSLAPASNGFDFYASFGDLVKGEETTTLLTVNFFIGPVPCNLEVSSYMHYGIQGGL
ncbi:MAG: C-type lectin domain-containing protein, partial [Myxococcales bacterium]